MPWKFLTELDAHIESNSTCPTAAALRFEIVRLSKQECCFCSGFGHAGDDCLTNEKLKKLRGGIAEQTNWVNELRKKARLETPMGDVSGFSTLSGNIKVVKGGRGKNSYARVRGYAK